MRLGVIIGRFQVDEMHEGHKRLVDHVRSQHGQVMVLLGVSQALGSKRNPLDYPTREKMVKSAFPDVIVAPLPDMPTNQAWSDNLDAIVRLVNPVGGAVLYGGRDSFIPFYKGGFPTVEVEIGFSPSGTEVRKLASNRIRMTSDFRAGVIYAYSNVYGRVFPTVDVAIVHDGQILLGRKPNMDTWCLPGGFVDQADRDLEVVAMREAAEETGLELYGLEYVGSMRINDWRYRHPEDGSVMTSLFVAKSRGQKAVAGDDLQQVQWFDTQTVMNASVGEAHRPLIQMLLDRKPHLIQKPKGEFL